MNYTKKKLPENKNNSNKKSKKWLDKMKKYEYNNKDEEVKYSDLSKNY